MSGSDSQWKPRPSAAARAEAAAWVARLHGPNRTREVEAGFRRWMADDPERAAAFELLTDTWEKSSRLRRRPFEQVVSWELPGFRVSFSRAAFATVAVAVLAVVGTIFYLRNDALATAIGEQRTLTLEDGTRVYLNTNSRAEVHYDEKVRRVELEKGEALFEVAKRPEWPFVVTAGSRQIRALGTAFIVRHDEQNLAVTLVEGKVTVSPTEEDAQSQLLTTSNEKGALEVLSSSLRETDKGREGNQKEETPYPNSALAENVPKAGEASASLVFTLTPGQRLTFAGNRPPQLDQPSLEKVMAWQRGQVALDNTPLADAVAEMNRYSKVRVVIEDPEAATIQVSGVFRAGDTANFAQAVGQTYGLQIRDQQRTIVLAGKPTHR